jgi:hypothetical protein
MDPASRCQQVRAGFIPPETEFAERIMRPLKLAVPLVTVVLAGLVSGTACSGSKATSPPTVRARTYRMGFTNFPAKPTDSSAVATLKLWVQRGDAAIIHTNVPYTDLLSGMSTDSALKITQLSIAQYYRQAGLKVVYEIDVTNGLNRAAEDPALDSAGRSITDTAIQRLYRRYVASVVKLVAPDYLGLASEVNLIHLAAPAPVYAAVVAMTNAAANDVRQSGSQVPLYVSMQVETAWGRLSQPITSYIGISQELTDFSFMTVMGLSSYPYLGQYTDPSQVPLDYYTRLDSGHARPKMVVEGGWASHSAGSFVSSPALQAQYIARQAQLLDTAHAIGVFQLEFADINFAAWNLPAADSTLNLFATLGLVDSTLAPKPALAVWDSTFARPLAP